jgi:hypothetical protein
MLMRAGLLPFVRCAWDFLWLGVLGADYQQRLFAPPPLGLVVYRQFVGRRREGE